MPIESIHQIINQRNDDIEDKITSIFNRQSKGYQFSGSDNINEVAWYSNNSGGETRPVGEKNHNELGIYDMSGNVEEWCYDWWYDKIKCRRIKYAKLFVASNC